MSTQTASGEKSVKADGYALRVLRVEPGQALTVRFLSDTYGGLLTHWIRGRSVYCPGRDECPAVNHRLTTYWKGYLSTELWSQNHKLWFPNILELTEHSELDIRKVCKRGQVWLLSRSAQKNNQRTPVTATFLELRDPAKWPAAHDYRPILHSLYHADGIKANVPNPMPAKITVQPSGCDGPDNQPMTIDGKVMSADEVQQLADSWKRKMREVGVAR